MDLNVHLPTLMLLSIAVNLLVGGLLWAVYHLRRRQACFRLWALACATFVLGSLLAGARTLVDLPLLTVLAAHLLLGASPLLVLAGIHSLMGVSATGTRRSSRFLTVAGVVYVAGLLICFHSDAILARLLTALFSALLFALAIGRLLTIRRKPRLPFRILQTLFAVHGLLLMTQVLVIVGDRAGLVSVDLEAVLTLILANHLLLASATAMALPLLAFTEAERSLRFLAERDELTQLHNRRSFLQLGAAALDRAKRARQSITVLMIDLDYFKLINDRWGHDVGDQALQMVARIMVEELRDEDVVGRIGGEEFAAVLNTNDRHEVEAITARLRRKLEERGQIVNGLPLHLSASIGGVATQPTREDFSDLMRAADQAMYEAKRKGRNRVELHSLVT